jgi:hypothetical protein
MRKYTSRGGSRLTSSISPHSNVKGTIGMSGHVADDDKNSLPVANGQQRAVAYT